MRGIAILLVIFGHAQRGIFQAAQPEGLYWSHIYPALDYFIYVFHVPVFFATSGILLERQARNSFRDFRSRETRIIGLYLLWNFINAVPAFVFSDLINRNFGKSGWIVAFNPLQISGIMWFFVALGAGYLAHFLTTNSKSIRWLLIIVAILLLAFDRDFHGVAYGTLWLLVGAEAERLLHLEKLKPNAWHAIAVLAIYLVATTVSYWLNVPYTAAIVACAGALVFLVLLGELISVPFFISYLGKNTLALYVMHVIALGGTRILLMKFVGLSASMGLLVLLTIIGIVVPLAVLILLRRIGASRFLLLD